MALNGDILGIALNTAATNYNNQPIDTTDPVAMANYRLNFWKAIGAAMVAHITAAGVVNVTVATTGTASAQTGTGKGKIT